MSFKDGAVSVVAPIIACEGGVAAVFSLLGGEQVDGLVLLGLPLAVAGVVLVSRGEGEGSSAGVVPAAAAALIWGGVLALSAPVAHDLGAGWAFLLVRGSAVVVMLPVALAVGAPRAARIEWWRVAIWGVCDAIAYFAFVLAADHGPAAVAERPRGPVRHGRCDRGGGLLRRAPAPAADRGHRHRGRRRRRDGAGGRSSRRISAALILFELLDEHGARHAACRRSTRRRRRSRGS